MSQVPPAFLDEEEQTEEEKLQDLQKRVSHIIGREVRQEEVTELVSTFFEEFNGPWPHPEHFERYAAVTGDNGKSIVDMSDREQAHRHKMQERMVEAHVSTVNTGNMMATRGQVMIYSILATSIIAGIVLIAVDKPTAGFTSLVIGVGTALFSLYGPKHIRAAQEDPARK